MPGFVFGMRIAEPLIAFHTTNRCRESADHIVGGRNSLAQTLGIGTLVTLTGVVHQSGIPPQGILRRLVGIPSVKKPLVYRRSHGLGDDGAALVAGAGLAGAVAGLAGAAAVDFTGWVWS